MMQVKKNAAFRRYNNCPREDSPKRQLCKGFLSNDTVVQGNYCQMGPLSKEAFTSEKLAQIDLFYYLLEVAIFIFIEYRMSKTIRAIFTLSDSHLAQK